MEMSKFQETWITFNLSCFAENCNMFSQRSSRNVSWTVKLAPTFHQHGGEEIMTLNFHLIRSQSSGESG